MTNNIRKDIIIEKYQIRLRLVDISDSAFILSLRNNDKLAAHLSKTSTSLSDQEDWITKYKQREEQGLEFYFLAMSLDGKEYGTTRLYNFESRCFEIGSWIFSREAPLGIAIKADIIAREFGFENLGFKYCRFQVRKANLKVLKYHKSYNPDIVGEDDLNLYFEIDNEKFIKNSQKLIKLLD